MQDNSMFVSHVASDQLSRRSPFYSQEACLKINWHGYEISVHFDNSCGAWDNLGRSSIMVSEDVNDMSVVVTDQFFPADAVVNGEVLAPDSGTLFELMTRIKEKVV